MKNSTIITIAICLIFWTILIHKMNYPEEMINLAIITLACTLLYFSTQENTTDEA